MLTEPTYGDKMKQLFADQVIGAENQFLYKCMRSGRLLRVAEAQYLIVGRNEAENAFLDQFRKYGEYCTAVTPRFNDQHLVGPTILIFDFSSIKGKLIEFAQVQLKADIEELEPGKCSVCATVPEFVQQEVKFVASEELRQFAKQAYSYFCKGKGKMDCVCDLNGELVEVKALSAGTEEIIRSKLFEL